MTRTARILALAALACPLPASADLALDFPGAASQSAEEIVGAASYRLPVGPYAESGLETIRAEGAIRKAAWRTATPQLSTLDLLSTLRDQLTDKGYSILFECETEGCGGFDFRFAVDLIPEPEMHVDLGDFRYLAARRVSNGKPDYVGLMVSRSLESGYVQITRIADDQKAAEIVAKSTKSDATRPIEAGSLAAQLADAGVAVLSDLDFGVGSAELAESDYASLDALAQYLEANPGHSIALVGHTDFAGSLDGNVALSRKRAASVLDRLVGRYGIDPARLDAQGVGYLAPVASNETDTGRAKNRRVEVVITSTQ